MSNTKHTPGPWIAKQIKSSKSYHVFEDTEENGLQIATVYGGMAQGMTDANAKLIAAAPELLAIVIDTYLWIKLFSPNSMQHKTIADRMRALGLPIDDAQTTGIEIS